MDIESLKKKNRELTLKLEHMCNMYLDICEQNDLVGWSEINDRQANQTIEMIELERVLNSPIRK